MTDEQKIMTRLLNVLPPMSIELSTFLRIFDVKFTDQIDTACITCETEPQLLLNRDFIEQHCKTDEHLFMLVMHEIYHIILGHTRLFPHPTPQLNIIFDAIINAMLCHMFPAEEYTSFFTSLYPSDTMPYALLRPIGQNTPREADEALKLLYGYYNHGVTYHDIFRALKDMRFFLPKDIVLLGSHSKQGKNTDDITVNKTLFDAICEVTKKWENNGLSNQGIDYGGEMTDKGIETQNAEKEIRRSIRRLMCLANYNDNKLGTPVRTRTMIPLSATTFFPNANDRTAYAKKMLYGQQLLFNTQLPQNTTTFKRQTTYVYLDVSGSVMDYLPQIFSALRPYIMTGQCRTYGFSTKVAAIRKCDVRKNTVSTTCGTDIECVMRHLMALPASRRPRKVLLLTDGYTGNPSGEQINFVYEHKIKIYCALMKTEQNNVTEQHLRKIVKQFITINLHP